MFKYAKKYNKRQVSLRVKLANLPILNIAAGLQPPLLKTNLASSEPCLAIVSLLSRQHAL